MQKRRPNRLISILLLICCAVAAAACAPQTPQPQRAVARANPQALFTRLALRFEANAGQADPAVRFLARGPAYTLLLGADDAVLDLRGARVQMRLVGAARDAQIVAEEPLAGVSHYLIGSDPAAWRTGVPNFGRVVYRGVYPGIDLVFRGADGRLEYDFVVAPGADAGRIRLAFSGVDGLSLDAHGDLRLAAGGDTVLHRAPHLYETRDGKRRTVAGRLVVDGDRSVRFEIAARDPAAELVIDPVVEYASYLGASNEDQAYGVGVDAAGNLYVGGLTNSPSFPTTPGSLRPSIGGGIDTFVTKFDPTGSTIVWSTFLGGLSKDAITNLAVDPSGHAYVVGSTASPNFPVVNAAQATPSVVPEAFIAKLASGGDALVWSTYLGGVGAEAAWGIEPDPNGEACVAGETTSPDFPTLNPAQPNQAGLTDAFVARFGATGALQYATYLGGSREDLARDVAADSAGNCIAAGQTISTDFPTFGALQSTPGGNIESFVAKYDLLGARVFATYLGGAQSETARGVVADASGHVYVTGGTYSRDFPIHHAAQPTHGGDRDAFVTKLTPDGAEIVYSTLLGGAGTENLVDFGVPIGGAIALDPSGAAYLTGSTTSTDFPTVDPFQAALGGTTDAFVAKLTPDGGTVAYASYLGGGDYDQARGIAVDAAGRAFVAGETFSLDLPVAAPFQPSHAGSLTDGFFAKIAPPSGVLSCAVQMSQAVYVDGETVTASVLHFANASAGPQPAQLRLLFTLPGSEPVAVFQTGGDGSFYLPAGLEAELGPVPLLPVGPGLARGDYAFACELVDPLTGAVLFGAEAEFALQ